jgi:hypothetical protein
MICAIIIVLSDVQMCDDDVIHFLYTGIYGKKINQIKSNHVINYQRVDHCCHHNQGSVTRVLRTEWIVSV